jgi:hypothetical protein
MTGGRWYDIDCAGAFLWMLLKLSKVEYCFDILSYNGIFFSNVFFRTGNKTQMKNFTTVEIEPIRISETVHSLDIHVPYILNGSECMATVAFKNAQGIIRRTCRVPITPSEFQNWTVSDEYILGIILSKLNLEKQYFNRFAGTPLELSTDAEDWSCPFQWLFEQHEELAVHQLFEQKLC